MKVLPLGSRSAQTGLTAVRYSQRISPFELRSVTRLALFSVTRIRPLGRVWASMAPMTPEKAKRLELPRLDFGDLPLDVAEPGCRIRRW